MQKREIIFVYLPNTSHFMHFQSVRQKKWNIHDNTNKYRWHFRSKPHQTTSLKEIKDSKFNIYRTTAKLWHQWYSPYLRLCKLQHCYNELGDTVNVEFLCEG